MTILRMKNRLLARLFTAFPSLAARWGKGLSADTAAIPWTAPVIPLRHASVALVTTGGVHLKSQQPFNMADHDGDASFREVPVDSPRRELMITHDYYDHRDADADPNLVLPLDRCRELVEAGALGSLHPVAYSFMGHIDGRHLQVLTSITAPEVASRLAAAGVDYVLLIPG